MISGKARARKSARPPSLLLLDQPSLREQTTSLADPARTKLLLSLAARLSILAWPERARPRAQETRNIDPAAALDDNEPSGRKG